MALIIWAIRKAFQCILQGVRFLLANHTPVSPTSENDSYVGQGCTSVECVGCVGQPKWIGAPPSHRLPSYFVQLKLFICRKSSNFVQQGRASPELTIFCSTLPWNANISIPLHISKNKNDRLSEVFGAVSMLTFNNTLTLRESSLHVCPLKKLAALKESLRSH